MTGKWKLADLGRFFKESLKAIMRGEFLLRINCSKYFIHIIWTFFLFFCMIGTRLIVENTLTKYEDGKKILSDMQIYHAQKTAELVSLGRMTTVEQMLQDSGSKLAIPQNPPSRIEK